MAAAVSPAPAYRGGAKEVLPMPSELFNLVIALLALVMLDVAAFRFGVDSRRGLRTDQPNDRQSWW